MLTSWHPVTECQHQLTLQHAVLSANQNTALVSYEQPIAFRHISPFFLNKMYPGFSARDNAMQPIIKPNVNSWAISCYNFKKKIHENFAEHDATYKEKRVQATNRNTEDAFVSCIERCAVTLNHYISTDASQDVRSVWWHLAVQPAVLKTLL